MTINNDNNNYINTNHNNIIEGQQFKDLLFRRQGRIDIINLLESMQ